MSPVVETSAGRLRGDDDDGVAVFRGVRYAAPPLGALRWRPPQPVSPWSGEREAVDFGPSSLQSALAAGRPVADLSEAAISEDCLYLNVWTPACDGARRPVLVWIHGGAFVIGSGALALYRGAALAARGDVVVVTVNYRLGLFGWLRSPQLGTSGNEGLADQAAALAWVHREIAAFGGDPGNVTVFGESAGAISIAALLAGGGPKPFRRAILQSGAHNLIMAPATAEQTGRRITDHLAGLAGGSTSPEALRRLPADVLAAAQEEVTPRAAGIAYGPVRDGDLVPDNPAAALAGGSAGGITVLAGTNRDEMGFFWGRDPRFDVMDDALLTTIVGRMTAPRTDAVIGAYRAARQARGETTDNRSLAIAIASDWTFRNGVTRLAECQARHARSYLYLFDWTSPLHDGLLGAGHLLETPFVFGTHHHPTCSAFAGASLPGADDLADDLMDAWIDFARHGDPGWPAFTDDKRLTRRFGTNGRVDEDPLGPERLAWADLAGAADGR